jgi:uncharacterized protein YndB with AHSA1/START domain
LTNSTEFGRWFGMRFDGPFVAGTPVRAVLAPSSVDRSGDSVAQEYAGISFLFHIEEVQPEHRFSFRWHPFAIERGFDYSNEPMTLVSFQLEESPDGTLLTVTESGFDRIPLERRAKAFSANEGGWAIQMQRIETHLSGSG